jgi:hypothetical protein
VTNTDIQRLLDEAVATLKTTTVGYSGHSAVWRANQTTMWWKGLDKIRQARAALDPVVVPPSPPSGVAPPVAPGTGYTAPAGTVASTDAQLRSLLAGPPVTIIYAGPPTSSVIELRGHKLWADTFGRPLGASVSVAGNGSELHGFAITVTDVAQSFHGDTVHVWGTNATVTDCVLDGSFVLEHGVNTREVSGFVIERCEARRFREAGFYLVPPMEQKVADGVACSAMRRVTDLYAAGIHWPNPGSSFSSECGVWIGSPVTDGVSRIETSECGRKGLETSVNARDTLFTDIRIHGWTSGTGNCVYHEHDGYRLTFRRFHITGRRGFMCEWNESGTQPAGSNDFVWEDGLIDGTGFDAAPGFNPGGDPPGSMGWYMDEGTVGGLIRRVRFVGQTRAAVNTYKAKTPVTLADNSYAMDPGVPVLLERHLSVP